MGKMKILFCLENLTRKAFLEEMGSFGMRKSIEEAGADWAYWPIGGMDGRSFSLENSALTGLPNQNQECILVTDSCSFAGKMSARGFCVIGYQADASGGEDLPFFEGADTVITSFECIDNAYFREVLLRFLGKPVLIAETERLLIRESTEEDFDDLYRIAGASGGKALQEEEERERFAAYLREAYRFFGYGLWTTALKTGRVIGRCGISPVTDSTMPEGRLELGYLIAPAFQRQGYGFEASRAILDYAFQKLDCPEIYASIEMGNTASHALARKLGFQKISEGSICLYRLRPED